MIFTVSIAVNQARPLSTKSSQLVQVSRSRDSGGLGTIRHQYLRNQARNLKTVTSPIQTRPNLRSPELFSIGDTIVISGVAVVEFEGSKAAG